MTLSEQLKAEIERHAATLDSWRGLQSIRIIAKIDRRGSPTDIFLEPQFKYPVPERSVK